VRCPRCGSRKSWRLGDGRRRGARCRHDWRPGRLPLRLAPQQWRAVLQWFVRGVAGSQIARETGLERKRVLRALMIVRGALLDAAPQPRRPIVPPRATRAATIGLRLTDGHASAELVAEAESEQFASWLRRHKGRQPVGVPRLERFTAIVYRGRLHRIPHPGAARSPFGQVEAFWAYLQRQLRATGGIRSGRLPLYLAAYTWRYNRRTVPFDEQVRELLALLRLM
jgi:hypothetical protein